MLKTGDYDLWSMRMEQYLTHTDYALWEVIVNGDAPALITSVSGSVKAAIPPKPTKQKIARRNELKAKTIKTRFGGNKDSKKMQKTILKQQYENFAASRSKGRCKFEVAEKSTTSLEHSYLVMRNKSNLDTLSMDDLYTNLKVYEAEIKGQSNSSSNSQNVAFVYSDNTSSTNEAVNTAHDLDNEDLKQIDTNDLEEMDLKWHAYHKGHFARECRAPKSQRNKNRDITRKVVPVETPAKSLVVTDGMGYDWSYQAEERPTDFALMAFSSSCSSSSDTETGLGYDNQLNERDLNNKINVFESASDSSVNESEEDNNQANDRYKAGEGYHVVPPPYTGNFMPPRPDLSFVGLDDSVFKCAISEIVTSVHETETSASKTSKKRKSMLNNKGKATCQREVRPVWNNAQRVNHQNFSNNLTHPHPRRNYVPTTVITNSDYQKIDGRFVAFGGSPKGGTIYGKGGLTCLFAKATIYESNLWHRRFGHINFKTMNKLVSGNLVRGLPLKIFENDHTCVAYQKGKQHKASYHLGKFEGKVDEEFLVGYSINSKAFRVFNSRTRKVEENLHIRFLENKSNVAGRGNQTNDAASIEINVNAGIQSSDDKNADEAPGKGDEGVSKGSGIDNQEREVGAEADTNNLELSTVVSPIPTTRVHKDHPKKQIIGDLNLATQTRRMIKFSKENAMMDVKSAFLFSLIEKEVYVCQPPGFEDPHFPNKVYKVEKALYGLHQAPKAWYETLSTYLLENGFRRGTIYKTLFIKNDKDDILLVQVYVDDILFGSTKKSLCDEFKQMMHKRFQMSSIGELTFFLGLQVKQKDDGIFISQDKYVAVILKKFDFTTMKTANTPIEPNKALLKDAEAEDVDMHLYRSMIRSLMYLTTFRPDIMFVFCACTRFQVTPKTSHIHAVKRIFIYLKG
uniref:Uncharacterized mitochondrial protein AtMg00810-like n=1 Tax=Tanacetum cinerariifolium TaxID=118510 RepID=A0A6L2L675_TANCI|nr:uncharacterized mitochondrial protein AtMg00810-like [Tanacetum cinerariifolium]